MMILRLIYVSDDTISRGGRWLLERSGGITSVDKVESKEKGGRKD